MDLVRSPELPNLPGFSFNLNIAKKRYPRAHMVDYVAGKIPYLTEAGLHGAGKAETYPSVYARGEAVDLPPWVIYDRQVSPLDRMNGVTVFSLLDLKEGYDQIRMHEADWEKTAFQFGKGGGTEVLVFEGYFEEAIHEYPGDDKMVHKCKIYFYLEDGTIKVTEKQVRNSGLTQGCLIRRQRIRYPRSADPDDCYDIMDFNVGRTLELYAKYFTLTNCDQFTRTFLNRLGISVPDPLPVPQDPYTMIRKETAENRSSKKGWRREGALARFLQLDGRILSFDAYWDDRDTEYGYLHLLKVLYYLADDTMEVRDVTDKDHSFLIVRRSKLPKEFTELGGLGRDDPVTLLNVLGPTVERSRSLADPLDLARDKTEYFKHNNLTIGAVINVFGRRVVLTDCDNFTKEFYRVTYGLDDFTPEKRPLTREEKEEELSKMERAEEGGLPPYNGFGTHEDSAINCRTVNPASAVKSYRQFYAMDKEGYDSRVLRFSAKLISKEASDRVRSFIVSYYLVDDTISVFEKSNPYEGMAGGQLMLRRKMLKPGEDIYSRKAPATYTYQDMFIGNLLLLEGFTFQLVWPDDYALGYMELHPDQFPMSNPQLVMSKFRECVKPVYKQFVARFISTTKLIYTKFRDAIRDVMGDKITDQEILTLARRYATPLEKCQLPQESLRRLAQDMLRRELYDDFERLRESFLYKDPGKAGTVTRRSAYSTLLAARLPIHLDLINIILDTLAEIDGKNEKFVNYDRLLHFFNYKDNPSTPIAPINIGKNMSWLAVGRPQQMGPPECMKVDISALVDDLHLEEELKEQSQ